MAFLKKPLKWTALGQEPSELKKSEGFKMDESPAPGHFDFMFRSTYEAIEELQQKAGEVKTVNNVQPDSNGNVLIPLPDVSKFYQKPTTGIPKTDLSADVQTALTKAESALQSVPLATAALDGLMSKGDKVSLDNVMSVFANLQKMKITNDDGSAVYTIGATLPTVKKGIFHAVAGSGTYAPPVSSVEGIIIAESASYWNFIGASDNGTWCVGTFQSTWKGWTTLATAKDVSNLSTRITALETSDTTHQADLAHVHWIGTATGTNTLTATYEAITALKNGLGVAFLNTTSSTLATTLNINGLGAIQILKANGNPVTNLKANGIYTLRYANGNFILQGEGGSGNATASDLLSGKTASTDAGEIIGMMPNRGTFNLPLGAVVPAGYYSGGNAPSGKKFATGTFNLSSATISGLGFVPNLIVVVENKQLTSNGVAVPGGFKRRGDAYTYSFRANTGTPLPTITFYNEGHQYYNGFFYSEGVSYNTSYVWYAFE